MKVAVRIGTATAGLVAGALALAGPVAAAPDTATAGVSSAGVSSAGTARVAPAPVAATFNVVADFTRYGQNLYVVGNIPALGSWNTARAVPLTTTVSTFPNWTGGVSLPANTYVEFQYIVKNPDGSVARWEKSYQNRSTVTPPTGAYLTHDTFGAY